MSDIPGSDQPTKIEPEDSATVFDNQIGDDWGEAFEADEFMQTPDVGESTDFFLEDEESTPSTVHEDTVPSHAETTPTHPSFLANLSNIKLFLQKSYVSFCSFSLLYRIALPALLLVAIAGARFFLLAPPAKDSEPVPVVVGQEVSGLAVSPDAETLGGAIAMKNEAASPAESDAPVSAKSEKVRENWRLPLFLIPAKDNTKGDDIFFVEADISLVFLLGKGESLPTSQGVRIRDIIYQFFTNRPIYELRRYSLARGEMNRKLRAWIEKQWSERHIATIVFNRYQVL